jgi:hypothetical protein
MKIGTLTLACAVSVAAVNAASAHHSAAAFDLSAEVTVEGTIAELEWKNPHIYFTIETTGADGQILLQQVEVQPISSVQSMGLTKETLAPGSTIILRAYVMLWDHRPDLDFSSASEICDPEIVNRFLEDL